MARKAGQGQATLLLWQLENMHAVADTLSADDLVRLVREILGAVEDRVRRAGGDVATWDPSDVEGSTAVCVWLDGPPADRLRSVAQDVRSATRTILDRVVPPGAPRTRVVVALGQGPCFYEREGKRVTGLYGALVNRLHGLARSRPGSEDAVVVEGDIAERPE